MRVELLPQALAEIERARDWYGERSPRAAEALLREVETALASISSAPRAWPAFEAQTRRYVLAKYPFSVIDRERAGVVQIVALAHHKRRPGYWRPR